MSRVPRTANGRPPTSRRAMPSYVNADDERAVRKWVLAGKTRRERMARLVRASDGNMSAADLDSRGRRYFRV